LPSLRARFVPVAERILARPWLIAAIAVSMVIGFGQATAAAALVDASCQESPDSFFFVTGNVREAETFTVLNSGLLTRAQVETNKTTTGGNFQLQILPTDGGDFPVDPFLAVTVIPDASVPMGATTLVGDFNPGLPVHGGQRLALVVTRPGGGNYEMVGRTDDPCPDSTTFNSSSQSAPWGPEIEGFDLHFQTTVDPTNAFTIGKLTGRKLTVTVPGKGTIALAGAKNLLKRSVVTASGPGPVIVKLKLTKAANQLLQRNGKLRAKAAITFTPTGGDPNTVKRKLKLKL
jgi:hypothetical protein